MTGPTAGILTGYSVSGAGDVNGDEYADIIVCADLESSVDTYNGACYLFLGSPALPSTLEAGVDEYTKWIGTEQGVRLGASLDVADFNGDGTADVIMGADGGGGLDGLSTYIGSAFIFYSPLQSGLVNMTDADAQLEGENRYDYAGSSVGSGDFNGDGIDDVSVGAPYYDTSRTDAGRDYIFYGQGF